MSRYEIKTLNRVDPHAVGLFISIADKLFLPELIRTSFSTQPTSILIPPTANLPSSVHFMVFPPAFTQPVHKHPDPRLLVVMSHSSVIVEHWEVDGETLCCTSKTCTLAGDVTYVRMEAGEWHKFATEPDGSGAIAFSFHPHDSGNDDVFSAPNLMEKLTTFASPSLLRPFLDKTERT